MTFISQEDIALATVSRVEIYKLGQLHVPKNQIELSIKSLFYLYSRK